MWLRVRKKENAPNQSLFREFRFGENVPLKAKHLGLLPLVLISLESAFFLRLGEGRRIVCGRDFLCLPCLVKIPSVWGQKLGKGSLTGLLQNRTLPFGEYYVRELQMGRGHLCLISHALS